MDKNVDSDRAIQVCLCTSINPIHTPFTQRFTAKTGFYQCLRLEFIDNEIIWPALFERHLKSKSKPHHAKTRAQHKADSPAIGEPVSFRFEGTGYDEEYDIHFDVNRTRRPFNILLIFTTCPISLSWAEPPWYM